MRHAVQEATAAQGEVQALQPPTLGSAAPQLSAAEDPVARLEKARAMLEKGLITPEEFAQVRERILATM